MKIREEFFDESGVVLYFLREEYVTDHDRAQIIALVRGKREHPVMRGFRADKCVAVKEYYAVKFVGTKEKS